MTNESDRPMATRKSVSLTALSDFIKTILPPIERDVPFLYHKPRTVDVETAQVGRLIFSVAVTKGIYSSFHTPRPSCGGIDAYFLHRPYKLIRHKTAKIWRRPRIVMSSHKVFDELLTVGWNVILAEGLGLNVKAAICLTGYKNEPDRKIGLLAPFSTDAASSTDAEQVSATSVFTRQSSAVLDAIAQQFGTPEAIFGFGQINTATQQPLESNTDPIRSMAIMNAFRPTEIERVALTLAEAGLVPDEMSCKDVLCLTGEPREEGIDAALARGMKVVCVGHRSCEDWGLKYLMNRVQQQFPELEIQLIDEPEEPGKRELKEARARLKPTVTVVRESITV